MAGDQRPVRAGLQIPQAGPNADGPFVTDFVAHARQVGVRSFWVGEHIVMGGFSHRAKVTETFLDPLVALAYLAGMNRDVELGTSVLVVPYRNPLVLLKGLCTIAHLTQQRLIVGVGAGWAEEEFNTLGSDFHRRGRTTDEFCEMFLRLRDEDEGGWQVGRFTYSGRGFEPRPTPLTELWIGGNSAAARRRAARYATGWQPTGQAPDVVREGIDEVRRQAATFGRDPEAISLGIRLRVRVTPENHRDELPNLFEAYQEAGVTDFLCEVNTRDRGYTLEAITHAVEAFRRAGVTV